MYSQDIISIMITTGVTLLLCRLIFRKKKKETSIEINNCENCPFRYNKKGTLTHSCKIQDIIYSDCNDFPDVCSNYETLLEMKEGCPIEGKLEILIKELKK